MVSRQVSDAYKRSAVRGKRRGGRKGDRVGLGADTVGAARMILENGGDRVSER
jgi:hypothetical protein